MPTAPYRALRVVLGLLSLLADVGGVLMIFSSKPFFMRLFLRPPESEFSTLLLFMLKEVGGFALMFSFMLFFACRDPARNAKAVDAQAGDMLQVTSRTYGTNWLMLAESYLTRRLFGSLVRRINALALASG